MDDPLERDERCFCCGRGNEHGLHLAIGYPEAGAAETTFRIPERFTGWKNMTHGGLLSMVADELMAHACISSGSRAVTAELTMRFVAPVATGTTVRAHGAVTGERGRIVSTSATLTDAQGGLIARATGKFLKR